MNSMTSIVEPDASGDAPKQLLTLPYLKLSDGNEIPILGYGLGTANHGRHNDKANTLKATVLALQNGYIHLDGAEAYENEEELGRAIKESGVPRSRLFITTKTSCNPGDTVEAALTRSLAKLGVERVDLYLIHTPSWSNGDAAALQAKWAEMEAVQSRGLTRSIGVSNYDIPELEAVLATAKSPPVVDQIEYHPYLQQPELLAFLREKHIAVEAYAPLTALTKAAGGPLDQMYAKLAKKYGVTASEIALRWCIDQGLVVLTTSAKEERLREYLSKLPAFKLTPKEVDEIAAAGKGKEFRGFWLRSTPETK